MKTFHKTTFSVDRTAVRVVNCTHFRQNTTLEPHNHEFVEFTLVQKGHAIHRVWAANGTERTYPIGSGHLFMVALGETHTFELSGEPLSVSNVLIEESVFGRFSPQGTSLSPYCTPNRPFAWRFPTRPVEDMGQFGEMNELIAAIDRESSRDDAVSTEGQLLRTQLLLYLAARHCTAQADGMLNYNGPAYVLGIVDRLQRHCCDSDLPSLEELAAEAGYSVRSLTAHFRAATGESVVGFVHRLRVEKAQYLLTHTDLRVSEIALSVGFEELSYFNRVFRRVTGMSPGEWRRR